MGFLCYKILKKAYFFLDGGPIALDPPLVNNWIVPVCVGLGFDSINFFYSI